MTADQTIRWVLKPVAFAAGLLPFGWLIWAGLTGNLSVNPLEDITHETGRWALRFLCITLAITPLRQVAGLHPLIRFRRMAGLFAFFYGSLHFLIYVIADRFAGLDFPDGIVSWTTVRDLTMSVGEDIYERPFITVGFAGLMCMVPLAATSTARMIRRLGGRRWQALHRLVYAAAVAGVVHFWWLVKADMTDPQFYATIVAVLLGFRVVRVGWKWRASGTPARATARS